jgi:inner membrane protein
VGLAVAVKVRGAWQNRVRESIYRPVDNVTHGLAGMLMADVTVQGIAHRTGRVVPARLRRAAVVLGIAAAEFPDSDLVYSGPVVGMGQLGYLLHHRGHTHTLVWASLGALLLWFVARWYMGRGDEPLDDDVRRVTHRSLLGLAFAGTWSHIALDWTNSYGVHPFWPLDNRWFFGDAVFIVEPWFWLLAIPPLLWGARSRGGRVVLALLALLILAASLFTGQVAPQIALLLLAFAVVWTAAQPVVASRARAWVAIALWLLVEIAFFGASSSARSTVAAQLPEDARVLDVVLNPAPADPTCWSVLAVTQEDTTYRLTSATVGPFGIRPASGCVATYSMGRIGTDVLSPLPQTAKMTRIDATDRVHWRSTWSTPVDSLRAIAATRCEVAAAFRFMRTPVWMTVRDSLLVVDARYGVGGGFNEVMLPGTQKGRCPVDGKWVPPWTPPRADLLTGG